MKQKQVILFLFFKILLGSCDSFETIHSGEKIYFVAPPEIPSEWTEGNGLEIDSWYWKIFYIETVIGVPLNFRHRVEERIKNAGQSLRIRLEKGQGAVLTVYPGFTVPVLQDSFFCWRPGGAVLLWADRRPGEEVARLKSGFEEGYIASLLQVLISNRFDIRYFNVNKLRDFLQRRKKRGGEFLNPWEYDQPRLMEEIASLRMSGDSVKRLPRYSLPRFPVGFWQELDVLEAPFRYWAGADSGIPVVSTGRHYFFEIERRILMEVELDKSGNALYWFR